jgi:hypothetical protein
MTRKANLLPALLLALVISPRVAEASKNYPEALQSYWRMGKRPIPAPGTKGCMLCHKDDAGGNGTATRPFGATLKKKAGVVGGNTSSLQNGLYYLWSHDTNSDGDPVSDYVEVVVDGTDPNDGRKYKDPTPPAPEGGQGGAFSGEGGEGGQPPTGAFQPPPPPPPPSTLAPPYTHGCALGPTGNARSELHALSWAGALGLTAYSRASRARRRRSLRGTGSRA